MDNKFLKEENAYVTEKKGAADGADAEGKEKSALPPKFRDVSALAEAYNALQAEFTRRCQRLKELEALAENPKQEKSDRSEPKNAENENGGKAANDSAENESVQAGASPANDENKSGGSFGEKNCEGPADASGKDEKQSDDAAAEKSGSEKEKGENADLRKTACREEKKESEQSEGIASAAKNPLSEEELEAAVFANENVRLKIIGDYLSSLKKNGAPLVRGGTGTLAAPPLKASTIEDAGGMALRFLQKNA